MLTLAFDTATRCGRFALAEAGALLRDQPHNVGGNFADALMPVVQEICAATGRRLDQVAAVAVARGPGSFTGVRIAVATAKALAWALAARLIAVPTTAAMAAALLDDHTDAELAVPALDARRGEIYAALYRRRAGWVEELIEPAPAAPDTWWSRLQGALEDIEAPVFGGDGVAALVAPGGRLRGELSARGRPVHRRWSSAHPATARSLAVAASRGEPALTETVPFALRPLYLRTSDAEVKLRVDLTPIRPDSQFEIHRAGDQRERPANGGEDGD